MIVVRNVFRLKFGMARQAKALWHEGAAIMRRAGLAPDRALTDVTGPFYTFVLENSYASLAEFEERMGRGFTDPEWAAWYQRFLPLVESGHRELFEVVKDA
jgi:hypothetical protein